ncbi:MAG: hypothetical protein LIO43_03975 [Clostridiales bacterium]|nr:hypothetical protein [Clostridiales bacterium]
MKISSYALSTSSLVHFIDYGPIATSISVECEKGSNIVKTYNLGESKKEYAYSGFLFDNILQINSFGNFEITLTCSPNGITKNAISAFNNLGNLEFTVTFLIYK